MNKAVIPHSMIIHFSVTETFDDGTQAVTVDRAILPAFYEAKASELEAKVNSGECLSPTEEQVLRRAFHLRTDEVEIFS